MTRTSLVVVMLLGIGWLLFSRSASQPPISGAPPDGIPLSQVPPDEPDWLTNFQRPAGPAKVGIQVGHWQNDQVPDELINLKGNTGASGGGYAEWQVNMAIAEALKQLLEANGVIVELLPTTIPPRYYADVFISIHADGSTDPDVSGYKFAGPWRDLTGKSARLVAALEQSYDRATDLPLDPNVTRNMRGYYAFAWWRYTHAIHPITTAVIAETGFLTNPGDRAVIVDTPKIPAQAMAEAITSFLASQDLL